MSNEQVLPYSAEAERAVLGSILINPAEFRVLDLTPSDFYVQVNGIIYATMIELDMNDIDIDIISLTNALSESRQLEIVGGMNYLIELTNEVPSSMNAETYARIVKDKANRRNIILKARELTMAAFDPEKDITNVVANTVDSIVANVNVGEGAKPMSHVISELIDQVESAIANPQDIFGIPTGFAGFDKVTRGLQKKEVAILAGEPGVGKSSFAVQLGIGMAKGSNGKKGKPGAIYELEMSSIATIRRVIAYESRVEAFKLRTGRMASAEIDKFTKTSAAIAELPIYISDYSNWTTMGIRSDLARLKSKAGIEWVIIDYLSLLKDGPAEDSNERSAVISDRIHSMAKDLDISILAVHDLTKAGITGAIQGQAGLAGSRRVVYNADMIMFLRDSGKLVDGYKSYTLSWEKFREDDPDRILELRRIPGFPAFVELAK